MKKFKYSLQTVLDYKEQILDKLKGEYAQRMALVREKEREIEALQNKLAELSTAFDECKREGGTIDKFLMFTTSIENTEKAIEREKEKLAYLQKKADEKKKEVIEANIDVNKFDKLKDKKIAAYKKEVQKDNENFIDEFVSNAAAHRAEA